MWLCGSEKAPGPDGFNFKFFKRYWNIIGKEVVEAVQFFGVHKTISGGCNSSFITLVPKSSNPLTLSDFRPINLIGSITKIISKTLAERLKMVIGKVIDKKQTGFVTGRNINDGPLMVNEVISWAKRSKKKILLFKTDFEKAFDTLNWNFLDNCMEQMGFGRIGGLG